MLGLFGRINGINGDIDKRGEVVIIIIVLFFCLNVITMTAADGLKTPAMDLFACYKEMVTSVWDEFLLLPQIQLLDKSLGIFGIHAWSSADIFIDG